MSFDKLVTSLRTAIEDNGILHKKTKSYNDTFDAFRLALRYYKINQSGKSATGSKLSLPKTIFQMLRNTAWLRL